MKWGPEVSAILFANWNRADSQNDSTIDHLTSLDMLEASFSLGKMVAICNSFAFLQSYRTIADQTVKG